MPYLSQKEKDSIDKEGPTTPGQLNFLFTKIIQFYLARKGVSYSSFNDILGAFEGAKLEFYRRVVSPYEDNKITENGDVYSVTFVKKEELVK